jgi:hypothetical protein
LALLVLPAAALAGTCLLPRPVDKGARIDENFQHVTASADGFFHLHWNSTGDSALAPDRVPRILAALEAAHAHYQALPEVWEIPLGPRPAYPVLVLRQPIPGATTLPFSDGGVVGLTWIQLDHDFSRWGGDPDRLLEATCAHELFHALQFAQGADTRDLAFYEASAVWAEDQVFPDHDDWSERYLPALLADLHRPLDQTGAWREYGAGAVLKYLLHGEGSWRPCRLALELAGPLQRCWPLALHFLEADPATELAGALGELLRAGDGAESRAWRVPELAAMPPVARGGLPALTREGGVPAGMDLLPGLSWRALPLEDSGVLRLAGRGAWLLREAGDAPEALADSARLHVQSPDWLLLVNASTAAAGGLQWVEWEAAWRAGFRVWPNPGGHHRWIEFAGGAFPLECFNLLGQRVGGWSPPGPGPGPFRLELPPAATGTLLLRDARGARGLVLTLAP